MDRVKESVKNGIKKRVRKNRVRDGCREDEGKEGEEGMEKKNAVVKQG